MRLALIAVGRLKDGPERELCERYRERAATLGRGLGLAGPEIIEDGTVCGCARTARSTYRRS